MGGDIFQWLGKQQFLAIPARTHILQHKWHVDSFLSLLQVWEVCVALCKIFNCLSHQLKPRKPKVSSASTCCFSILSHHLWGLGAVLCPRHTYLVRSTFWLSQRVLAPTAYESRWIPGLKDNFVRKPDLSLCGNAACPEICFSETHSKTSEVQLALESHGDSS